MNVLPTGIIYKRSRIPTHGPEFVLTILVFAVVAAYRLASWRKNVVKIGELVIITAFANLHRAYFI